MAVDIVDIAQEIYTAAKRLQKSDDKLVFSSKRICRSRAKYRQALRIELMKLRNEKVPVSIVDDVAIEEKETLHE